MENPVKVFIERLDGGYLHRIREGLSYIDIASRVRPGEAVFIKPNLTFPHYRQGVMTSPECIEQLVVALKDYTDNITIGESDGGGYNRFLMEDVFAKTGLTAIAARHGVKLVNLSRLSSREIHFDYQGREFSLPLPVALLEETQLFITVPVPKVHANTQVSMSIKNQWGCIQEPSLRLKMHPFFKKVIMEINRALKVQLSLIDGKYGLNRNGPMRGDAVELGWIMLADNIVAADLVCCKLMGINPLTIEYLAFSIGNLAIPSFDTFQFNRDYQSFIGPQFYLKRDFWDYPGYFAFRSPLLAYLAYHSPAAGLLHKILYLFRDKFYDHK
jgi:uncharacterized protein (DUF362 family)